MMMSGQCVCNTENVGGGITHTSKSVSLLRMSCTWEFRKRKEDWLARWVDGNTADE